MRTLLLALASYLPKFRVCVCELYPRQDRRLIMKMTPNNDFDSLGSFIRQQWTAKLDYRRRLSLHSSFADSGIGVLTGINIRQQD